MMAGGRSVGPVQTDRGTEKTYCENIDWDTNETFCHPEYLSVNQWGDEECDTWCAPFGGNYRDNGMG